MEILNNLKEVIKIYLLKKEFLMIFLKDMFLKKMMLLKIKKKKKIQKQKEEKNMKKK